ncbi:MAG: hypothetical protein ACYC8T_06415 [Myxococcaceae bacterium]
MNRHLVRPLLVAVLVLCACASKQPSVREEAPAAGTSEDEILAAFAPPPEAPTPAEAVPENNVPPLPEPPEDPSVAARASFAGRFAAAKVNPDAKELPALEKLAELAGPPCAEQVAELAASIASASKDPREEQRAAERWLRSCGPEGADKCRGQALRVLQGPAKARAAELKGHDECLRKAEASRQKPSCLDGAMAAYRRMGDALMVARVHLARGRAEPAELAKVERACAEPRCLSVRRQALKASYQLHLRNGEPEEAAKAALSEMQLAASREPVARRRYLRTDEVDRACASLDAKAARGACRKLEKAHLGGYSFRDFSLQQVGEGLPAELIRPVNEQYGVLLEECLAVEATRLVPPASVTYRLRWVVLNDGRVDAVHVSPADQGELAKCVRAQFGYWRYPRYQGEWQHVEQSFSIRAQPR